MVLIVVAIDFVDHYYLMFNRAVVHIIVADYNVDHLCLTQEWFILLCLVILLTTTVFV